MPAVLRNAGVLAIKSTVAVPVPLPAWYDCVSALICRPAAPNVVSPEPSVPEWEVTDFAVMLLLKTIAAADAKVTALAEPSEEPVPP